MTLIRPLSECPDYAPVLAYWSYNVWYRKRPIEYDLLIKAYQKRSLGTGIPQAFVAIEEGMPVGMASLKNDDLWSRKDLNPWLASLYVIPEFRRQGIAEALISAVIEKARGLAFPRLYLFLGRDDELDLELYYKKRGWRYKEDSLDNDGNATKIFFYNLD